MRAPIATLTLLMLVTGTAAAQEPLPQPSFGQRSAGQPPYTVLRSDGDVTRTLIIEREMMRARERTNRIEARRWLGINPQRPSDDTQFGWRNQSQYRHPHTWYAAPAAATFWGGPAPVRVTLLK